MWAQKYLGYRLKIKRSGTTLVILGTVVMSEVLWMVPVALLWCGIVYALVVRHEEQLLLYVACITIAPLAKVLIVAPLLE